MAEDSTEVGATQNHKERGPHDTSDAERNRLAATQRGEQDWRRWGAYLSERQWGTIREDYSATGESWASFPHDHARSRAYRWGEDGLLGISDSDSLLCFALALWNERDPILKERTFGLTNPEGNHGEDVKDLYYYLDAIPTASYLKALYKYPQAAFPYEQLLAENRRRRGEPEFELLNTGIFDENRYFDVFVEYAKADPNDVLIRITVANRGPEDAPIHVLPTLWFRNTWSWNGGYEMDLGRPSIRLDGQSCVVADHSSLGRFRLVAGKAPDGSDPPWLFTENETNNQRLYGGDNAGPYVKDAFHDYVVQDRRDAVNPDQSGTKAAALYRLVIPAGETVTIEFRLSADGAGTGGPLGGSFDETFERRIREADAFYIGMARAEDQSIFCQACAGLLWSKQFYYYVVRDWLTGDPVFPAPADRLNGRNSDWKHVFCRDVISMPDKWEFPWFAAWDLAFHVVLFGVLDPQFGREQMILMLREWYMHPDGQLPAYEYAFGDVNPPVHAWACRRLHMLRLREGDTDLEFVKRVFMKLMLNFTWWLNRKDVAGKHLFSGGFLGLDNIGVFDRSMTLPQGVTLEQADGTAWMAMFCSEMLSMALELANSDPAYEDIAIKFFEHFVAISSSINSLDGTGLWNDEDGFYYDHIRARGQSLPLPLRSAVGLLPLVAAVVLDEETLSNLPEFRKRINWFIRRHPEVKATLAPLTRTDREGRSVRRWLLALPTREQLERILRYVLDENEFLSPHGIRSLSRVHRDHPFTVNLGGQELRVSYLPGESDGTMFGGNSNWRGPVWLPINLLLIEALHTYHHYYGDTFQVDFPSGSGQLMNLHQVAHALSERLIDIFRPDPRTGRRPCHGEEERYATDPHWRDLMLFNEYFHGDTGRGCGASHQTGWTGLVTVLAYHLAHTSSEPA